jgi:hypothetical protein
MPSGTKITTGSGQIIPNVVSATIRITTGDPATVDLEIVLPMFDIQGLLDTIDFDCPVCTKRMTHECWSENAVDTTSS